jgi:small conductance mechanosensitive channel
MTLTIDYFSNYANEFVKILLEYSPKLISAIVILIVGIYGIRIINRVLKNIMIRRDLEPTLSKFFADILNWALKILLFVTFISKLGIETSSFVAILGAGGLAVGLSLQGSLSNFAGGMLIILFKPFRVGDTIEAQGVVGTVSEIQIFVTKIISGNNQTIFVPNGALSNGNITNYSVAGTRRADLQFVVSYSSDLQKVKSSILMILKNNPKVLTAPAPVVEVSALVDNGIRISVKPWSNNENYGEVCSSTLENIKLEMDRINIEIQPFLKELSV